MKNYVRRHQKDTIELQTQHFLVERTISWAAFVNLTSQDKGFEAIQQKLMSGCCMTANSFHIVKQLSGECAACRGHLGGYVCHWRLTTKCDVAICWKLVYGCTIYEHAGWGSIKSGVCT